MTVLNSRWIPCGIIIVIMLGFARLVLSQQAPDNGKRDANQISRAVQAPSRPSNSAHARRDGKVVACIDSLGADRLLCDFLVPGKDKENQEYFDALELTTSEIDLNGDNAKELVVWESSWSGTSGGSLWILAVNKGRYKKLFEGEMTWSPILVLPSEHHGWRDISFFVTGGGATPTYITIRHNGRSYHHAGSSRKEPAGEVLIEKQWKDTLFGPSN